MVDVQQDGVEAVPRCVRVKAVFRGCEREEVALHEVAAGVGQQPRAQRQQSAAMPLDHRREHLDQGQPGQRIVLQHGAWGVAQAESADHHVQPVARECGQARIRQRLLRGK